MSAISDRPDTSPGVRPTIATACGKVILLGEHSVVYGEPAIAVPLPPLRLSVVLAEGADPDRPLAVDLEEGAPPDAHDSVSRALGTAAAALDVAVPLPVRVAVRTGGLRSGMGTSAALGVAMARALLAWHGEEDDGARVLGAAEAVERLFHGNPSGIDHTVSAMERPLWFIKGKGTEALAGLSPLRLVLLRRQSEQATVAIVGALRERLAGEPALVRTVADMGRIARESRSAWEAGDLSTLASGLNAQQAALDHLGVVHVRDREAIAVALDAGALAAKITGAGAGGSVLALVPDDETSQRLLTAWGPDALAYTTGL
ncbi:MAG: mevalonate kinase [Deltaproteobacteria bacterium]|nr:mevalonate kinase [Deltaproteobacteria bacterium]